MVSREVKGIVQSNFGLSRRVTGPVPPGPSPPVGRCTLIVNKAVDKGVTLCPSRADGEQGSGGVRSTRVSHLQRVLSPVGRRFGRHEDLGPLENDSVERG